VEDVKLTRGAVHIAFGDNHAMGSHPKIRGQIPSILHVDAAELNATLKLDGKTVIDNGKLLY
jgi:leucyl aminopeptidase (aminopeptidase T)